MLISLLNGSLEHNTKTILNAARYKYIEMHTADASPPFAVASAVALA